MAYWLVKSPFRSRTWARVVAVGEFRLYGIRNAQARNNIAQMQSGDEVFFYFQQAVWGVMQVEGTPVADPTSAESKWLAVTFKPVCTFEEPIVLGTLKAIKNLSDSPLLRQPRLSAVSLSPEQWDTIKGIVTEENSNPPLH